MVFSYSKEEDLYSLIPNGSTEGEYLDANTSFERHLKQDDILAEFLLSGGQNYVPTMFRWPVALSTGVTTGPL